MSRATTRSVPASAVVAPTGDRPGMRRGAAGVVVLLLVALAVAAYANSLGAPFLFDDRAAIAENDSIRHWWPPGDLLSPPPTATGAVGRPLVNVSLALNYAAGGLEVRGYHAVNIALHAAVALVLFGVLRRALQAPRVRDRFCEGAPFWLAAGAAALWTVHPLLTESVTGIIQRSELLGSFWYALTGYCFLRSTDSPRPARWQAAGIAACWLGAASKEFIASAPLLVLLLDRALVAGTLREAWRRRRGFYLGLAASWILLAVLIGRGAQRGGTVGFGLGVSSWDYLLTQCRAIVLYLRLAFWPAPLVLDYGDHVVSGLRTVAPQAALLVGLLLATVYALVRRPALGALAAAFFAVLAPSSSFVPLTTQTIAEHRMYLPLFAVITLVLLAVHAGTRRPRLPAALAAVLVVPLAVATVRRNTDYATVTGIWSDTVAKCPDNARALTNLGNALSDEGRLAEAAERLREAVALAPDFAGAHYNLGTVRLRMRDVGGAIDSFATAARLDPENPAIHNNLAAALARAGRFDEAVEHYEIAITLRPRHAPTHFNLGNALLQAGRREDAIKAYRIALRLQPDFVDAHYNLAGVLLETGRAAEAVAEFEAVLRAAPDDADARAGLARARQAAGAGGAP